MIEEGKKAPDFKLINQSGETVQLKEFKGKKNVVLYFYPKAMTPGCTTQACGLRDVNKELEDLDTVVLGVSPDSPSRLEKFIGKQDLNFTLLSDEDHQVAEDYGVWQLKKNYGREYMGIVRTTFVISKQGKLHKVLKKFKTKDHHEVVMDVIKQMD